MAEVEIHFHGGPAAGERWLINRSLVKEGTFYYLDQDNGREGLYVSDATSAGGRCFDWSDWR